MQTRDENIWGCPGGGGDDPGDGGVEGSGWDTRWSGGALREWNSVHLREG